MSRRPYENCQLSALQHEDPQIAKIRELQRRDPELSEMIDFLESDNLPFSDKKARNILLTSDRFYLDKDGLLYHLDRNQKLSARDSFSQLVVPQSMKFEILSNVHDHVSGAQFGTHKTFHKLKQRYWWKGMFLDTDHWCKLCTECSMRKSPRNSKKAPLLPLPVANAFEQVAVDVLGPFPVSRKGNRYVVVFRDMLTRFLEAFAVPSVEASVIARLLVDEIIARYGARKHCCLIEELTFCRNSLRKFVRFSSFTSLILQAITLPQTVLWNVLNLFLLFCSHIGRQFQKR